MESNNQNKIKELQKINKTDLIYIGVIILLFIIIGFIFAHSTGFIIKNINKIFSVNEETATQTLDIGRYSLIEKKLNLPQNKEEEILPETKEISPEQTQETTSTVENEARRKDVDVRIINTTNGNNADSISKELKNIGFETISNQTRNNVQATSTVLIKDSKKEFTKDIENILIKYYPNITFEVNTENSIYDIIIVAGK